MRRLHRTLLSGVNFPVSASLPGLTRQSISLREILVRWINARRRRLASFESIEPVQAIHASTILSRTSSTRFSKCRAGKGALVPCRLSLDFRFGSRVAGSLRSARPTFLHVYGITLKRWLWVPAFAPGHAHICHRLAHDQPNTALILRSGLSAASRRMATSARSHPSRRRASARLLRMRAENVARLVFAAQFNPLQDVCMH
jgi:hypothetical protein